MYKSMPKPIIKSEEDADVIIDLECLDLPSPKDKLDRWHKSCTKMLAKCYLDMSEKSFEDFTKHYLRSLSEHATITNNKTFIKEKMLLHISDIHIYHLEARKSYLKMANYYQFLEDVLSVYVNLEFEIAKHIKKREMQLPDYNRLFSVTSLHICKILSTYLCHKEEHVMHVLMKICFEKKNHTCRDMLNLIFTHYVLSIALDNRSDESFCRSYLVVQMWKEIQKKNEHQYMDNFLFTKYQKTVDYISTNEFLMPILKPELHSISQIVTQIMDYQSHARKAYFEYVKKNRNSDDNPDVIDFISIDDECMTDNMEFGSLYNSTMKLFPMDSSSRAHTPNSADSNLFKDEVSSFSRNSLFTKDIADELIRIDSDTEASQDSTQAGFVCIIDDDPDSDIEEIIYFSNTTESNNKSRKKQSPVMSFENLVSPEPMEQCDNENRNSEVLAQLESIVLDEDDVPDEHTNSEMESPVQCKEMDELARVDTQNLEDEVSYVAEIVANCDKNIQCDIEVLDVSLIPMHIAPSCEQLELSDEYTKDNMKSVQVQTEPERCSYYYGIVTPPSDQRLEESGPYLDIEKQYLETRNTNNSIDIVPEEPLKTIDGDPIFKVSNNNSENNSLVLSSCTESMIATCESIKALEEVDTEIDTTSENDLFDTATDSDFSCPVELHEHNTDSMSKDSHSDSLLYSAETHSDSVLHNKESLPDSLLHIEDLPSEKLVCHNDVLPESLLNKKAITPLCKEITSDSLLGSNENEQLNVLPTTPVPYDEISFKSLIPETAPTTRMGNLNVIIEKVESIAITKVDFKLASNNEISQSEENYTINCGDADYDQQCHLSDDDFHVQSSLDVTQVEVVSDVAVQDDYVMEVEVDTAPQVMGMSCIQENPNVLATGKIISERVLGFNRGEEMLMHTLDPPATNVNSSFESGLPENKEIKAAPLVKSSLIVRSNGSKVIVDDKKSDDVIETQKSQDKVEKDAILKRVYKETILKSKYKDKESILKRKSSKSKDKKAKSIKFANRDTVLKSPLPRFIPKEDPKSTSHALNNNNRGKIMYTSSQTIKETDFTRFESMYRELNDINTNDGLKDALSGPVTKLNGSHDLFYNDNFDLFDLVQMRSSTSAINQNATPVDEKPKSCLVLKRQPSSPTDSSPAYEEIDPTDFKNYITDSSKKSLVSLPVHLDKKRIEEGTLPKPKKKFQLNMDDNVTIAYDKRKRDDDEEEETDDTVSDDESSFIKKIRRRDERLQMNPVVVLEHYSSHAEFLEKYRHSKAKAKRSTKPKRYDSSVPKHNTTRSCILMKMNFGKNGDEATEEETQLNYSPAGCLKNWKNSAIERTRNVQDTTSSKTRVVPRKSRKSASLEEEPDPPKKATVRRKGRPPKSVSNVPNDLDRLLRSPCYTHGPFRFNR